jgi:NAD-dependent deacetylase
MKDCQKIVVFTGAGISAESGISTFRDKNGLWENYDAMRLASIDGFRDDPKAVLDFYNARRKQLYSVNPNRAHYALAELEKLHDVTIITQNVDDLHERAGSSKVIHLHGELTKVTSSIEREDDKCIKYYPLNLPICIGDKADDGSQLRPYIVWFGEYLRYMDEARQEVENADIFIVVGTSLVVYPAAGLVGYARKEVPKFLVDPSDMEEHLPRGYIHIKTKATEGVDLLIEEIKSL